MKLFAYLMTTGVGEAADERSSWGHPEVGVRARDRGREDHGRGKLPRRKNAGNTSRRRSSG